MGNTFHDHPRKKIIREYWDTRLLNAIYERRKQKFFYFGLPGPQAIDVRLWKKMLCRIIAFEIESEDEGDPRRNLQELSKNLALLGIPSTVFCGPIEEVILDGRDRDGQALAVDQVVTLFNLDFCNALTGRITTRSRDRKCLRFEAIREIAAFQRALYRKTNAGRFVLLITAENRFHVREMIAFIEDTNLPAQVRKAVDDALSRMSDPLPTSGKAHDTDLLRIFAFICLREYLQGQNTSSVFLPPVVYNGTSTAMSPMIHFAVLCSMEDSQKPRVSESQSFSDYIALPIQWVTDNESHTWANKPPDSFISKHFCAFVAGGN